MSSSLDRGDVFRSWKTTMLLCTCTVASTGTCKRTWDAHMREKRKDQ
jgi:hypothetical protein